MAAYPHHNYWSIDPVGQIITTTGSPELVDLKMEIAIVKAENKKLKKKLKAIKKVAGRKWEVS